MDVKGETSQRFTQKRQKNPFAPSSSNSFGSAAFQSRAPKTLNPNKAVFTIDSKTGQILIVNNNACQLLGYESSELRKKNFYDFLASKSKSNVCALAEMQLDSENGTMVLLSGKVVEMITKNDTKVAVSLWIRQIDPEGRCLAVAEHVERRVCEIQIDRSGLITHVDREGLVLFQYESVNQMIGIDIYSIIPAIKLPDTDSSVIPKALRKQKATGRTADNVTFPLCLLISLYEQKLDPCAEEFYCSSSSFNITIWVFQNLSGLIVIDEHGFIQSCNPHFSLLMFGYAHDKIQNMHITSLVPHFCKDTNELENRSRNLTNSSLTSEEWEAESDAVLHNAFDKSFTNAQCTEESSENNSYLLSAHSSTGKSIIRPPKSSASDLTISTKNDVEISPIEAIDDATTPVNACGVDFRTLRSQNSTQQNSSPSKVFSAASIESTSSSSMRMLHCSDGRFKGEALHADGNVIDILYAVSSQTLPCARKIYCIWICRDPDSIFETDQEKDSNLTLTFNSITSTVDCSLGQVIKTTAAQNTSRPNSVSFVSVNEEEQVAGDFNKHYTTLKQIGKGAYGFVKMAYRNTDRLLVITKFIFKDKLCSHFMVIDDQKKEVPIEIYILRLVKHPNIVSILDVFENDSFFQLVMEKHGSGMDLFEFIERRPLMDEKLGSYIFRQIANAVHYLHSLNILHRDIKDENIIIDHSFHIKLIDFGSATFMEEGKLFSTFFGTTEYCSPEVLAGNKYAGPELEMWSLGVTLYVIMFFENPFIDVEETLKAELIIPHSVSDNLQNLLFTMLNKDPTQRCSMNDLIENPWLLQEVNPALFNFSWIVPCEPFEANPEKYYNGRISSSTTALSTISPQESLSLVDEGSIVDNEVENNKEDREYFTSQRVLSCKVSEHNSWSGNMKDVYSMESLEEDTQNDIKQSNGVKIDLNVSGLSTLTSCEDCCLCKDMKCSLLGNSAHRNHLKTIYSLSKMNVSDFALDFKKLSSTRNRCIYLDSSQSELFDKSSESPFSLSKSLTNIPCSNKSGSLEPSNGAFSLNSLNQKETFPICKIYANFILNEFSESQLEKSLLP